MNCHHPLPYGLYCLQNSIFAILIYGPPAGVLWTTLSHREIIFPWWKSWITPMHVACRRSECAYCISTNLPRDNDTRVIPNILIINKRHFFCTIRKQRKKEKKYLITVDEDYVELIPINSWEWHQEGTKNMKCEFSKSELVKNGLLIDIRKNFF